MADLKRHHYVPKFMLKAFSKNDTHLAMYDLATRMLKPSIPLKGQCKKDYLYGKNPAVEKSIGRFEDRISDVFHTVRSSNSLPEVGSPELEAIVHYAGLQYSRTIAAGAEVKSVVENSIGRLKWGRRPVESTHNGVPTSRLNPVELGQSEGVQLALRSFLPFVPVLLDLGVCLLVNESDMDFVLSDTGVVFHNEWARRSGCGARGVANAGLLIMLPIGVRHAILAYDREVYGIGKSGQVKSVGTTTAVVGWNSIIVEDASQRIYASVDSTAMTWIVSRRHYRSPRRHAVSRRTSNSKPNEYFQKSLRGALPSEICKVKRKARRIPDSQRGEMMRSTIDAAALGAAVRDVMRISF